MVNNDCFGAIWIHLSVLQELTWQCIVPTSIFTIMRIYLEVSFDEK